MIEGSFCTAARFQYQRGPRIGILIKGGVSNKRQLSVKYGVRVRHTTTAISTRKKKRLHKQKRAALAGQRTVHCLITRDTEGRKHGKEVYFVVKKHRAGWSEAACRQTPKCMRKNYTSEKCTTKKKSNTFSFFFFLYKGQTYLKKKNKQIINNML